MKKEKALAKDKERVPFPTQSAEKDVPPSPRS